MSTTGPPLVATRALSKTIAALADVTLAVPEGRFVAVTGRRPSPRLGLARDITRSTLFCYNARLMGAATDLNSAERKFFSRGPKEYL